MHRRRVAQPVAGGVADIAVVVGVAALAGADFLGKTETTLERVEVVAQQAANPADAVEDVQRMDLVVETVVVVARPVVQLADRGDAVAKVEGVGKIEVELVWDPPWNMELMSDEAKVALDMW